MLEAGLASIIMAFASITFIRGVETYEDATRVSVDSQETTALSEMLTAYIRENERAFIATANGAASPCGAVGTTANGGYVFQVTGSLPHNPTVAGGPYACYNLSSFNLLPQGFTGTNRWHQTYYIAVSKRADTATGGIAALLFTSGGGQISEHIINAYLQGLRGNGIIYGRGPSGPAKLADGGATETTNMASLDQNLITQGHIGIDLTNEITPNLDESVERDSTLSNAAPQHMNSTLYFAGLNPYSGSTNNLQLNGPVVNELDSAASKNIAAATNSNTAPTNGVFGARQVSTQMLTPGNSLQTQYGTNSAQAQAQHAKTITVNDDYNDPGDDKYNDDNGTKRSRFANNYLAANANIDITAGYRLSSADGIHVTATTSTIQNDFNNSPNGAQNGEVPINGYGVGPYIHTVGIPGVTWDAAQGSGLMIYNNLGERDYAPNDPFGATFWIATYAKNTVAPGLEATGGMRSPVYYSDRNMAYYFQPDYFSRLSTIQAGDINLIADGQHNPGTNRNTSGSIYASNTMSHTWPNGWSGTGVYTFDLYSDGGTIAVSQPNESQNYSAAFNRDGAFRATGYLQAGIFRPGQSYAIGSACTGQTINYLNYDNHEKRDPIQVGDKAKSNDSRQQPIYCDGKTNTWKPVIDPGNTYICTSAAKDSQIGPIKNTSNYTETINILPTGGEDNNRGRDVTLMTSYLISPSGATIQVDQSLMNSVNHAVVAQFDNQIMVPPGWSWQTINNAKAAYYTIFYVKFAPAGDTTSCPT